MAGALPLIRIRGHQLNEGFIGQLVALLDHGISVRIPELTDQCFRLPDGHELAR